MPAYPKLLKEKFAPENVLASSHVKFHKNLHPIEWRTVAKSSIPSLNQDRIDYIMSISGAYSINPIILMTMLMMDSDLMKIPTHNEFNQRFREMAENMARTHLEGQDDSMYNTLDATVQQLYQDDENKLQNFHNIYSKLHTELNIPVISQSETLMLNERDEELQPSLSWPWRQGECWEIGPSHGGSVEGLDVGYVPSSLDMGPSLYISWNHDYKFLGMDGSVVASHTGHVYIHSTCSVEITAGRYSTYYAHIKVRKNSTNDHFVKQGGIIFFYFYTKVSKNLTNDHFVKQGDVIGTIESRPDLANCLCNWATESYSCSNGPHLHWEVRRDGFPISLDKMHVGGIQITTGIQITH